MKGVRIKSLCIFPNLVAFSTLCNLIQTRAIQKHNEQIVKYSNNKNKVHMLQQALQQKCIKI